MSACWRHEVRPGWQRRGSDRLRNHKSNVQCAASVVLQPRNLWRCVKKRHLLRAIVQTAKHFSADGGLRQSLFALAGALSWMAGLIIARRTMRRFEFAADAFAARAMGSPEVRDLPGARQYFRIIQ